VYVEDEKCTSEHFDLNTDRNRITGDLHINVLTEIFAVRRVEDLRLRNCLLENANSSKEICKNAIYGVNNHKGGNSDKKYTSGAKEDVKVYSRGSGASAKNSFLGKSGSECAEVPTAGGYRHRVYRQLQPGLFQALFTDPRVRILSFIKLAAFDSKFNAIIHKNKGERRARIS